MDQPQNIHQAVKGLVSIGLPKKHAEGIVKFQLRFLNENVATKQDVLSIQHDIEAQRLATQKDIESLRAETKKDIQLIHKDIESLRAETKKVLVA